MDKLILIIENDKYTILKIDDYLKALGFKTLSAKSGELGLVTMRKESPDLIILSNELYDLDATAFLERKKQILDNNILVIILSSSHKEKTVQSILKQGAKDYLLKPVILERLKDKLSHIMPIPTEAGKEHLMSEIFIRDGIIFAEIGGFLINHEIVSMKYRILDAARADHSIKKRFYIIIYNLEEEKPSQVYFDKLFDFTTFYPKLPKTNVKILTSNEKIKEMLKTSEVARDFEVVDNYVDGLNRLKALYLEEEGDEILVEFLKPNTVLYRDVYDQNGNLIKEKGKSFTQDEIQNLLNKRIKKLQYTRSVRIGDDRQIFENEDVDVVMDAVQVKGIVIPEELKDISIRHESKKRLSTNILIVNSNKQELNLLYNFFTEKGFPVKKAITVKKAYELSVEMSFNIVIIDTELEDGNGLDLVRTMKEKDTTKSAQFILTGKEVKEYMVKTAIELGVKGFLKSPFNKEKLDSIIK